MSATKAQAMKKPPTIQLITDNHITTSFLLYFVDFAFVINPPFAEPVRS
jgi:hypothetical protein